MQSGRPHVELKLQLRNFSIYDNITCHCVTTQHISIIFDQKSISIQILRLEFGSKHELPMGSHTKAPLFTTFQQAGLFPFKGFHYRISKHLIPCLLVHVVSP